MSRTRDIANILGKTENANTGNEALLNTASDVGSSLSVYSTLDDLPSSGLTSGDQAFVSSTSRFYISNGSGWYNVALINATPTLTIDPAGAVALAVDGVTPTVITLTATDSDNPDASLTYSVDSDGNFAGLGTISQDSSVFTITPLSEDSATTTASTLTFKASDGISFGSGTTQLTLLFKAEYSNYTTFLAKADTAGTDDQVDASTNTHSITETGNVTSTALTPYHPGGYSTHLDGSNDYLQAASSADFGFGTGDFTVEWWANQSQLNGYSVVFAIGYGVGGLGSHMKSDGNITITRPGTAIDYTFTAGATETNTWYHVALVRSGTDLTCFVNGVSKGTITNSTNYAAGNLNIGIDGNGSSSPYNGYISDFRVVKGTAVYTSNFTPPTQRLTAIANTSLLTCHLPYIADGSGNNHTVTANNGASTERIGPYEYVGYTKTDHGGSVYLDGTGDYLLGPSADTMGIGTSNFTIECWFYATSTATNKGVWDTHSSSGSGDGLVLSRHTDTTFRIYSTGQILITGPTTINNAWVHLALVRDGTDLELFVNGISQATTTWGVNMNSSGATVIGGGRFSGSTVNAVVAGYIQDFRVTTSAVYTSNFTPPTEPLTAIANTQLLTCTNKNDIWDTGKGGLLTKVGNATSSNTQRKFATSSAMYFDGTGDYLSANDMGLGGANAFTIEAWMYPTVYNTYANDMYSHGANLSVGADFLAFGIKPDGNVQMFKGSGSPALLSTSAPCASLNQWYHIAFVRESNNNTSAYVNGVLVAGPTAISGALTYAPTGRAFIGTQSYSAGASDRSFEGYMQDVRITNGFARYTSAFTPPTGEFGA